MITLKRFKSRPGNTLLGLTLSRDRLEVVEVRRINGTAEVRQVLTLPLDADPLTGEPEAVGRALRQRLDAAGIREPRCVVCLPPNAVLSLGITLPDLPEADRVSLLQIEAERGFPQSSEDLVVASSIGAPVQGSCHATLIAVPRAAIARLERVLKAARLKPVSFGSALASLQPAGTPEAEGILALLPFEDRLSVQITCHQAIVALRVIDEAFSGEVTSPILEAEHVAREIRITLGQLSPEIRGTIRQVRIFGASAAARAAVEALGPLLRPLALTVEAVRDLPPSRQSLRLTSAVAASPGLGLALDVLANRPNPLEFLPPKVSAWQQFAARYPSRKLAWAGGAAGAVAAFVVLLFLGQQYLLWRWQSRWDGMKSRVAQVDTMQREIRLYRPWFDESVRSLGILRRLTESFPEDGSVTAKAVEIRAASRVTCSGNARDSVALLRMLDQLRNSRSITDVQVEQVRGKSPVEFTFNFRWEGPGGA